MSYERSTSLRFLRIKEEEAYAVASSRPLSTHAFNTFSTRASSSAASGYVGGRNRNGQLTLPLLLHDRFKRSAIDVAFAQRQFWNTVFERSFNPGTTSGHSRRGPADLKSWTFDGVGPNPKDSRRALGVKSTGFGLTSQKRHNVDIMQLSMQYLLAAVEDSTYNPGMDDELFENVLYSHYFLQSSPVRVALLPSLVESDMAGTVLAETSRLSVNLKRPRPKHRSLGAVASGLVQPLEVNLMGNDDWRVTVQAPTYDSSDHTVAQSLVTAARSAASNRGRYDLRIDLGGHAKTFYRAVENTPAIRNQLAALWGPGANDFNPAGAGENNARIYEVFKVGTDVDEYVPSVGDTIRYQGWESDVEGQDGGYVVKVGAGKKDASGERVSFWIDSDILHNPGDDTLDEMVPGGMLIHLQGMVLSSAEGLDNQESSQSFTFISDSETIVEVVY